MTIEQYIEIGAKLAAVAVILGPVVEFVVTVVVWLAKQRQVEVPAKIKQGLTAVLSVGGAAVIAGAAGIVPWPQVWVGAIFGLGSWLVAHANHKASASNEAEK